MSDRIVLKGVAANEFVKAAMAAAYKPSLPKTAVEHDHSCHCGGEPMTHHTGVGRCLRFMTEAPVLAPPTTIGDRWIVDGHEITDYTLREQRGYYQHPCGCWSRWFGSSNSSTA